MINKQKYSVLLILRKNDLFCLKFLKFISSKCKDIKVLWTETKTKKNYLNKIKKKFDYIISYRGSIILKPKDISKANIAAINLHPGSPKYRGLGCINYALYNNEKRFGFTIHLINRKIDYGKILFVKYFSINKNSSVEDLLYKTHNQFLKYSKKFFNDIFKNAKNITLYQEKFKKENWSKQIKNRQELDNFYRIRNFSLKEINRKIRATNFQNYKPFIQFGLNKFYLK